MCLLLWGPRAGPPPPAAFPGDVPAQQRGGGRRGAAQGLSITRREVAPRLHRPRRPPKPARRPEVHGLPRHWRVGCRLGTRPHTLVHPGTLPHAGARITHTHGQRQRTLGHSRKHAWTQTHTGAHAGRMSAHSRTPWPAHRGTARIPRVSPLLPGTWVPGGGSQPLPAWEAALGRWGGRGAAVLTGEEGMCDHQSRPISAHVSAQQPQTFALPPPARPGGHAPPTRSAVGWRRPPPQGQALHPPPSPPPPPPAHDTPRATRFPLPPSPPLGGQGGEAAARTRIGPARLPRSLTHPSNYDSCG